MTEASTKSVAPNAADSAGATIDPNSSSAGTSTIDGAEDQASDRDGATPEEAWEVIADSAADGSADKDNPFAGAFIKPGPFEVSPDGARLAYLLTGADGQTGLWISPADGGDGVSVEIPFVPIEDVDPDTGRVLRGPQWSPDGRIVAVTGTHPDDRKRTSIWLVPIAGLDPATGAETSAESGEADATGTSVSAAAAPATDSTVAGDFEATAESVVHPAPEAPDVSDVVAAPEASEASDASDDGLPVDAVAALEVDPNATASTSTDDSIPAASSSESDGAESETEDRENLDVSPPAFVLTEPQPLSDHATASDRTPRWSPDGMLIAFVRRFDGRDVIALASSDGAVPVAAELLTWSPGHDREPSWSRDGLFLAFTRKLNDGPEHNDIVVFILATGEIRNLTGEKTPAIRHSLDWVPGRNLVAFVTRENDWLSIAVINSDNKAGWTVTREAGDKTEPRFSPKEARLVYLRSEGFATVCCERGLHASGAVAVDPGEGVANYPCWVADKRVAYGFSAPQRPFGFLVQENVATEERTAVNIPGISLTSAESFRQPQPFEFEIGPEEQFSGLIYRTHGVSGNVPGIVYLPDGPLHTRRGEFLPEEQALASTAMAVLTPVIHGATGFGAAVENDLAELADSEIEIADVIEAGSALGNIADVDERKLAVVGHGYGGTLALLSAGARPGVYSAVAAVDPITDWSIELENADAPWRNWASQQYGMPLTERDRYALRSPETFAAVIDIPLILVSTGVSASRRIQLGSFIAYLDEVGVTYELIEADGESIPAVLRKVGRRLANHFLEGRDGAQVVDNLRADLT